MQLIIMADGSDGSLRSNLPYLSVEVPSVVPYTLILASGTGLEVISLITVPFIGKGCAWLSCPRIIRSMIQDAGCRIKIQDAGCRIRIQDAG